MWSFQNHLMCFESMTMRDVPSGKQVIQAICKTGRLPGFPFFFPLEMYYLQERWNLATMFQSKILHEMSSAVPFSCMSPVFLHKFVMPPYLLYKSEKETGEIRKRDYSINSVIFYLLPPHDTMPTTVLLSLMKKTWCPFNVLVLVANNLHWDPFWSSSTNMCLFFIIGRTWRF